MKNRQTAFQIITVLVSALLILLSYLHIVGDGTIFKGDLDGEIIKARVIRVTDVNVQNVSGENEFVTVKFKAQALNTDMRGKTVEAVQEIDKSYAFSPRQVEENDKILISGYVENGEMQYYFGDFVRITPLIWLLIVFCVLIVVFAKMQGLKTVVSLGFTCLSVFTVLIPAILNGHNIYLWSILVCIFITAMTLCLISGFNVKALCAEIGCICGVLCSGLITLIMDKFLNMTGLIEEESIYLVQLYPDNPINLKAIIFAMIIVGAVGAVMDVSMSISSSLYELRIKSPEIKPQALMKSGFTIGRDMMGTMANTLVLAYAGNSLCSTLLNITYSASLLELMNREGVAVELLQSLLGSMAILLTIPLTSIVCSVLYTKKQK